MAMFTLFIICFVYACIQDWWMRHKSKPPKPKLPKNDDIGFCYILLIAQIDREEGDYQRAGAVFVIICLVVIGILWKNRNK